MIRQIRNIRTKSRNAVNNRPSRQKLITFNTSIVEQHVDNTQWFAKPTDIVVIPAPDRTLRGKVTLNDEKVPPHLLAAQYPRAYAYGGRRFR